MEQTITSLSSNQHPRRTRRADQPRMGRSVSHPLTPLLAGAEANDTQGSWGQGGHWAALEHSPSTAGLEGGERPPALASGDATTLQWHLVLRVSRHTGRYLSNRMVRLALSDWTSRRSIQLLTGGLQPRSEGLMYRIP